MNKLRFKRITSIVLLLCINVSAQGAGDIVPGDVLRAWNKDHPYVSLVLKDGSIIRGQLKDVGETTCIIKDDKSEITVSLLDITEVKKTRSPKNNLTLTLVVAGVVVVGYFLYHHMLSKS